MSAHGMPRPVSAGASRILCTAPRTAHHTRAPAHDRRQARSRHYARALSERRLLAGFDGGFQLDFSSLALQAFAAQRLHLPPDTGIQWAGHPPQTPGEPHPGLCMAPAPGCALPAPDRAVECLAQAASNRAQGSAQIRERFHDVVRSRFSSASKAALAAWQAAAWPPLVGGFTLHGLGLGHPLLGLALAWLTAWRACCSRCSASLCSWATAAF